MRKTYAAAPYDGGRIPINLLLLPERAVEDSLQSFGQACNCE